MSRALVIPASATTQILLPHEPPTITGPQEARARLMAAFLADWGARSGADSVIALWLATVDDGMRPPTPLPDLERLQRALLVLLDDVETPSDLTAEEDELAFSVSSFSREAAAAAIRRWRSMPSAGEIAAFLSGRWHTIARRYREMRG
jgi:hypothetical protein